jgi:hypothetical protein
VLLRNRLVSALQLLRSRHQGLLDAVHLKVDRTARSEEALSAWFTNVRPIVASLEVELARVLGPQPVQRVDQQSRALLEVAGEKLAARRSLLAVTQKVEEAGQRLSVAVGELQLCARVAFAGQPALLRQFRKRLTRRAAPVTPPGSAANEPGPGAVGSAA